MCPLGEWEDEQITLRECTFSSPEEAARVQEQNERAGARAEEARERAEEERAVAQVAQVERLLANGASFQRRTWQGLRLKETLPTSRGVYPTVCRGRISQRESARHNSLMHEEVGQRSCAPAPTPAPAIG